MKNTIVNKMTNLVQPARKCAAKTFMVGVICTCSNTYADTSTIIDSIEVEK